MGIQRWPWSGRDRGLDPVAVERSCYGDPVRVSVLDRLAAVGKLTRAGRSGNQIAETLGITRRTVCRYRARLRGTP